MSDQGMAFWNAIITIGITLSMIASYVANQSFLWAILHGLTSWGYVLYRGLGYGA